MRRQHWWHAHENRVLLASLAAGIAGVVCTLGFVWFGDFTPKVRWTVTLAVLLPWWAFAWSARERVISPLRTLANLLEAMREGDYSIRGRGAGGSDALGEVMTQVNMGATRVCSVGRWKLRPTRGEERPSRCLLRRRAAFETQEPRRESAGGCGAHCGPHGSRGWPGRVPGGRPPDRYPTLAGAAAGIRRSSPGKGLPPDAACRPRSRRAREEELKPGSGWCAQRMN